MPSGVTLDDLPEPSLEKWSLFLSAVGDFTGINVALPDVPFQKVTELTKARPSPTPRPSRPDLANNGRDQTKANSAETLSFLSEALKVAPNDLDREEWVKIAASLKVEFGD